MMTTCTFILIRYFKRLAISKWERLEKDKVNDTGDVSLKVWPKLKQFFIASSQYCAP